MEENNGMVAELISVGTEILLGNIVNTNAAYLSEQCARLGLSLYFQTVVGDNEERLTQALTQAISRSDIVILTGGLGPTKDDLTKEVTAKAAGRKLVEDPKARKVVADFFEARRIKQKDITENNWKQALVPEGATVLPNPNGTAPGLIVDCQGKQVILLPGPPGEMRPMFEKSVFPYLQKRSPGIIYSRMVKLCGIGESKAASMIGDLIEGQTNPTIATYARTGEVHLRVTAKAENEEQGKKLVKPMVRELKKRFGVHIFSTKEDGTLEEALVDILKERKYSLATAESCTGGLLTARLVNVSGVSEVLKQGYVTYSNKAKHRLLGIPKGLIKKYSPVSDRVAAEMAKGAAANAGADVAIAVTGIAGPHGGTEEKPVGTVFIACSVKGQVTVREYHFDGNREKIRESSVVCALTLLRECILPQIR